MNARVRTCSHACAAGLRKRGKAEAVARSRARRREAQGVKGPMVPKPGSVMGEEVKGPQFRGRQKGERPRQAQRNGYREPIQRRTATSMAMTMT